MRKGRLALFAIVAVTLLTPGRGHGAFPDAHEPPPANWTGPKFTLSQNYPTSVPPQEPLPWKQFDFKSQPTEYLQAVLAYAYEGNIAVDWDGARNPTRKWYHAPWMHYGVNGREFIHGLTAERVSRPTELHPLQKSSVQNWAVSLYNAPGGYIIGKVWADENDPDPTMARFPDGTVAVKLLFTEATSSQVPYLRKTVQWQANIQKIILSQRRHIKKLRLLQIDIAVRDSRSDDLTGWVFGTLVYDATARGLTAWDRMVPVGIMWGNDPGITPEDVASGTSLKEASFNTSLPSSHPKHLGWAGRLIGPVDNPLSSCLSCHSTAQVPKVPSHPKKEDDTDVKLNWFRNIKAGQPFEQTGLSTDYSLQLSAGILNFQAVAFPSLRSSLKNAPPIITRE